MFRWTLHLNGGQKFLHGAAPVAVGEKVYSFGGLSNVNNDYINVHVFNTVSLRWRKLTPVTNGRGECSPEVPSSRCNHTAVLIEDIYIWGGYKYDKIEYCAELYAFDVDTHRWFKPKVSGTGPEARYGYSACVLGKVMYVHRASYNDIYKLDTTTMVWSLINSRDSPAYSSRSYSATIIGTKMFLFEDRASFSSNNILRVFDTETNCWLNTPPSAQLPGGRWGPSAFAYNGELYICGGTINYSTALNDLWKFSPESFSWKKVELRGKVPCGMFKMFWCIVGDRIIVFGGEGTHDDLYVLDLSPSLKTLCKLAVIQYDLEQSELTHNIRWELEAMTNNRNKHII